MPAFTDQSLVTIKDTTTDIISTETPDLIAYKVYLIIGIIIIVILVISCSLCGIWALINYLMGDATPVIATMVTNPDVVDESPKSAKHLHILKVKTSASIKTQKSEVMGSEPGFKIKSMEGKDWNKPISVNSNTKTNSTDSDDDVSVLYKEDSSESLSIPSKENQKSKLDSKLDSQIRSKLDSKTDSKLDSKLNSEPDSKPDTKPDSKPDSKPNPKLYSKLNSKLDSNKKSKQNPKTSKK